MGIDVIVVTNGSILGEELLKLTWYTAQKLFHEYGIEVYVIPYQVKRGTVTLVINGLEYPVTRKPSPDELADLILSAASSEGEWKEEVVIGATLIEEGRLGGGALVTV